MNYDELLKSRRSIRNFQDREVSVDIIKEIINESILAPNAGNLASGVYCYRLQAADFVQTKKLVYLK